MAGDPPITNEYDIVAVSPSLAVDSYYVVSQLRLGDVNRSEQTIHTAGGKGINMARAVKSLGGRALVVGAVGGETGRFIANQLDLEGIPHDLIWGSQETRRSCTIVNPEQRSTTVILEAGTPLAEAALLDISKRILRYAGSAPFLAFTGSLPPNVSNDFYQNLVRGIPPSLPVRVGLDASGESLRLASTAGVRIIKVNAEEFRQTFRLVDPPDWSAIRDIYARLAASGLQILVITSGAQGALVFSPDSGPFRVRTEVKDWVSTTGAGDTFMAGFLLGMGRGSSIQEAARFASAASAASIQHIGCGVLEQEDVSFFLTQTSLKDLEEKRDLNLNAGSYVIGIDIGGTNIKVGMFSESDGLLTIQRFPTPAQADPDFIVQEILRIISTLSHEFGVPTSQLKGLGVSIAAFISAYGKVTATAHLSRKWIGYDLNARLQPVLGIPCYYALDTVAPTLGEAYYGAGKGIDHFVYLTVTTGIGAGIIVDGKYFTGGLGWAGGVGHTIIDESSDRICEGCGNAGCLETFAAKQGILATARQLLPEYPHSLMISLSNGDPALLTPKMVYDAAQEGDPAACRVFSIAGHALGIALTNLVDIVAPHRVVIGGGIAQAGDLLLGPAREVVQRCAFPPLLRQTEIVQSELSDLSGIYGAAALVYHDLRITFPE